MDPLSSDWRIDHKLVNQIPSHLICDNCKAVGLQLYVTQLYMLFHHIKWVAALYIPDCIWPFMSYYQKDGMLFLKAISVGFTHINWSHSMASYVVSKLMFFYHHHYYNIKELDINPLCDFLVAGGLTHKQLTEMAKPPYSMH